MRTREQLVEDAKASFRLPSGPMQKAILDQAGVTETDVAKVLGVHRVTVNRWAMGRRRPSGDLLRAYAGLLAELQDAVK